MSFTDQSSVYYHPYKNTYFGGFSIKFGFNFFFYYLSGKEDDFASGEYGLFFEVNFLKRLRIANLFIKMLFAGAFEWHFPFTRINFLFVGACE